MNTFLNNPRVFYGSLKVLSKGNRLGQCQNVLKTLNNVFSLLLMVSVAGALKRTFAGKTITVHQNGSIDTGFDLPQFSLDSTFKASFTNTVSSEHSLQSNSEGEHI